MKGSMDRVHRDGPWTWGPCFVYVLLLDVFLCSIAEYFYELCRILASP